MLRYDDRQLYASQITAWKSKEVVSTLTSLECLAVARNLSHIPPVSFSLLSSISL